MVFKNNKQESEKFMKDTYFALDILCLIGSLCLTNPGEMRCEAHGHFAFCMKNFVILSES